MPSLQPLSELHWQMKDRAVVVRTHTKGPTDRSPDSPLALTHAFPAQSMHIRAFLLALVLLERFVFNYVYVSVCVKTACDSSGHQRAPDPMELELQV